MRASLKGISSPDVLDLHAGPAERRDFQVLLQIFVGPADSDGEESFDVMVLTPGALLDILENEAVPFLGTHTMFVQEWDFVMIENYLRRLVGSLEASDWERMARMVGLIGHWEYEDYK
jgi:hypothetical protein